MEVSDTMIHSKSWYRTVNCSFDALMFDVFPFLHHWDHYLLCVKILAPSDLI